MRVFVTGASGFLGRGVVAALVQRGDGVVAHSRHPHAPTPGVTWTQSFDTKLLSSCDAVVSLAGESIATRLTQAKKRAARASRVEMTTSLVDAIATATPRPRVLVSASAVGLYGDQGERVLDESAPAGQGFLAELVRDWEAAARAAEVAGTRVALLRLGVVLGAGGGALARLVPLYKLGLGGPLGNGRQWFPWIHREDVARVVLWALDDDAVRGPVNAVAPEAVRQREFAKALGHAVGRPALLPTPALALRLTFGTEMANATLLASAHVVPKRLTDAGFEFSRPTLAQALR
jgi:uncharacterized protein (TIGR01777 family)